jgi:hypothetical protein|nr:MAG TPA: hypothetical protein [Caudoviricetes sp.]
MKYIGFIWIYIDFKKSKQKIAPKTAKSGKAPSKPSKFCIFIKSLKSFAYAIKTSNLQFALFLKL